MRFIAGKSVNEIYAKISRMLTEDAEYTSSPRGLRIRECLNVGIVLDNPYKRLVTLPQRHLSMRYLAGELAFYLSGSNSLAFISHYSSSWNKLSNDGKTVVSAYGKRIFRDATPSGYTQFGYCLEQLMRDKDTRKAVISIYGIHDSDKEAKDNPCTMSIQFIVRDDYLHVTTTMRSNDVWFGVPYDIAFFAFLQELMLTELRENGASSLKMGSYTHFVGSLHAYERNWRDISDIADRYYDNVLEDDMSEYEREGEMPRIDRSFGTQLALFLMREEDHRNLGKPIDKNFYDSDLLNWLNSALGGD